MHRQDFITEIPKAELHLHIEGSLEPELMFALARRNRVSIPFSSIEDVRQAYQFTKLQDFLDIYYAGADVLLTAEDFRDLAVAYFDRAAADGVTHAEIFFDPQTHTLRGVPFDVVMEGLLAGVEDARRRHGMSVLLILCFLRHLDEDSAFATFRSAEKWFGQISGVGLDSSEVGHPPSKFAKVFAAAADAGLKRVAHAGEEGPPAYVYEALDILRVDRLDHGNRSLEDPFLISRLARDAMTLTVCPLSNLKLCVVEDLRNHPIDIMLEKGLRATLNSDDPAYFGGYVAENYRALVDAGKLSNRDVATLARNSFLGSFLNDEALTHQLERLDAFLLRHTAAL
ncbi:adenosine deaminase [Acetobacter malorum DSM 14337]|uniref:Adenine deaminase n=1 Tax=Acetobacter malorum DSM 14337 TaxID=1307910 RepID=A0ABQ0PVX1_9PROT|nr:adenosine deaminase [Acetobacter malorum]KXV07543.1 adenosine deaminase [Acetobacter malorum]GBQ82913.1 adenosine deaminase [Acetobacter malorum DSM 14337]